MKKNLLTLFAAAVLFAAPGQLRAQDHEPMQYVETVAAPEPGKSMLYNRAAEWVTKRFAFGPTSDLKEDINTATIRITGTAKIRPVTTSGKIEDKAVRFDFVVHCTEDGYDYRVDNFQYIADTAHPEALVSLEEHVNQLALEKATEKTHNDRRLRAQAMSLASEVAMSFRSYMNSMPVPDETTVGLPAKDSN